MNRQNWYLKQLVENTDMAAIESEAQGGVKSGLALWNNKGIVSGLVASEDGPSTLVSFSAGKIVLEDGSVVTTTAVKTVDLAAFLGGACVVEIWAIPLASSDTPLVTPDGVHINYRLFDDVRIIAQLSTTTHTPIPTTGYNGTLIAVVTIPGAVGSVINAYISQASSDYWVDVPALLARIGGVTSRILAHTVVAFDANPTFNAAASLSFEMVLTGDSVLAGIPGLIAGDVLSVIIIQNGAGGHNFGWPAGIPGDVVDPTANNISTFRFKKTADGRVVNLGGMNVNS